jgi:hypothetical protein
VAEGVGHPSGSPARSSVSSAGQKICIPGMSVRP